MSLRFFHMPTGVEVRWASHARSCLFHATLDGKTALCGARGALAPGWAYPCVLDPSSDTMTCEHCAGLVRRVSR
jgi:hypothetical protein